MVGGILQPSDGASKPSGGASMFEEDDDTMEVIVDKGVLEQLLFQT